MRQANKILLATNNKDKFLEFKALFKKYSELEIIPIGEMVRNPHALEQVEKHDTYLENAMAKARLATACAHYPSLGDDSGLEVEALNGKPGPRSARYAEPKPGKTRDEANREKLLQELKNVSDEKRKAKFVCALALVVEGICVTATGELHGTIVREPRGSNGFGYDSLFVPDGQSGNQHRTLAEMSDDEKNVISHRAVALNALMPTIIEKGIILSKP